MNLGQSYTQIVVPNSDVVFHKSPGDLKRVRGAELIKNA